MEITYEGTLVRQNESDQTVYFTLIDDNSDEYPYACDAPKGIVIQDYLNAHSNKFLLEIRRREWPDAKKGRDFEVTDTSELEAMEAWIAAGAPEKDEEGNTIGNYERKAWTYKHPAKSSPVDRAAITPEQAAAKGVGNPVDRIANLEAVVFGED